MVRTMQLILLWKDDRQGHRTACRTRPCALCFHLVHAMPKPATSKVSVVADLKIQRLSLIEDTYHPKCVSSIKLNLRV